MSSNRIALGLAVFVAVVFLGAVTVNTAAEASARSEIPDPRDPIPPNCLDGLVDGVDRNSEGDSSVSLIVRAPVSLVDGRFHGVSVQIQPVPIAPNVTIAERCLGLDRGESPDDTTGVDPETETVDCQIRRSPNQVQKQCQSRSHHQDTDHHRKASQTQSAQISSQEQTQSTESTSQTQRQHQEQHQTQTQSTDSTDHVQRQHQEQHQTQTQRSDAEELISDDSSTLPSEATDAVEEAQDVVDTEIDDDNDED